LTSRSRVGWPRLSQRYVPIYGKREQIIEQTALDPQVQARAALGSQPSKLWVVRSIRTGRTNRIKGLREGRRSEQGEM
jgi:hypothetical protein